MKIEQPSYTVLYPVTNGEWIREFELIEYAGRTAYKSEAKMVKGSYKEFIQTIIKSKHDAVLEFGNMIVKFITDRGITHEIVRHRLCSYLQESTRYCNYANDKFGNEVTFIEPSIPDGDWAEPHKKVWTASMKQAEEAYLTMIIHGCPPQIARSVLPNSLKTEIVIKANFREWRHIFNLRVLGSTGKPHPDMVKLMKPLYEDLKEVYPFMWDMGKIK